MQEDNKILHIATRIFIGILIIIFLSILLRIFSQKVLIDIMHINNEFVQKIAGNEESDTIEDYSTKRLFNYEKIIEISKGYEKAINWKLIRLTDEETPINIGDESISEVKNKKDHSKVAKNIIEFNEYLKKNNVNLLYVQAPTKTDNAVSGGTLNIKKDYSKENADNFIKELEESNVSVLDLRNEMNKENIDYGEAFFKTDHHWKPETGLWATKKIANKINELYNLNIDLSLYNIENYNIKRFQQIALGAQGKRVTLAKAKPEDFDIILPKFNTNLHFEIPSKKINKNGTFEVTVIDWERLNKDYYNNEVYAAYGYGNPPLVYIRNELNNLEDNVLIIKDSFANVITPYLALGLKNTYAIDLRYFTGSIKEFIKEKNIEKVIIICYSASLVNMQMFTFK